MSADDATLRVEQRILDKFQVKVSTRVPRGLFGLAIEPSEDHLSDLILNALTVDLTAYVLGERVSTRTVEDVQHVPASWWQHAKKAYYDTHRDDPLCRCVERRWPVLTRPVRLVARVDTWATYPHADLPEPDLTLGRVVYQRVVTKTRPEKGTPR